MTKKIREPLDVPVSLLSDDSSGPADESIDAASAAVEVSASGSLDSYVLTIEVPTIIPRSPESWVRTRYSQCRH